MKTDPLDWLVVGGGLHGVHLAARLIVETGVAPSRLRIVDPADRLLDTWLTRTERTGMQYLRSPSVHHIGVGPWDLERFAGKRKTRKPGMFAAPYSRPSLELFNSHSQSVVDDLGLARLHVRAQVEECWPRTEGVRVILCNGRVLDAERAILALGTSELAWPDWASRRSSHVVHIFDPGFALKEPNSHIAVVGGGITAVQTALTMEAEGKRVDLVSRHAPRQHQFDSDPGWLGPKRMAGFQCVNDFSQRRQMISQARHRGSAPPDVMQRLRRALKKGRIRWRDSEVRELIPTEDGASLCFDDGSTLAVDQTVLATGVETRRPGGRLVDRMVDECGLRTADCGYPIVDRHLRWHPRVHLSGALAELELGPTARNIAGARRAAARLVGLLRVERAAPVSAPASPSVKPNDTD
ncbi:MAG: FAD/NAD(P)-binding protein [Acidobacteriota bacterium]